MADGRPPDLPFRAEYAKTGRGGCKGCDGKIDKEELKLAVMVQSRFHDGKDARWYHVQCFFLKARPKTVGDISHFESLRWEDQQRIKKKIEAGAGPGVVAEKGSKKEAMKDYSIGYAKSGASTCQACSEKIPKGDMRVSKKDYDSDRALMFSNGAGLDRWHHFECFVKIRSELEFFCNGKDIPGFKDLEKEDKALVTKQLPVISPPSSGSSSKSSASGSKRKLDEADAAGPSKKMKNGSSSSESSIEATIAKQSKQMYKYRDALADFKPIDLKQILSTNKQEIPTPASVDRMRDRISDIMTFGALKPCSKCKKGQYVYRSGVGYQCLGYLTEYTKCMNMTDDPPRVPFKVPNDLKEVPPFPTYKFKAQKRVMQHFVPSETIAEEEKKKPKLVKNPLQNFKFMIVGFDKKKSTEIEVKLKEFGGEVAEKSDKVKKIAALISTQEALAGKVDAALKSAEKCKTPVVGKSFVESLTELNYNLTDEIKKHRISTWETDISAYLKSINKKYEERGQEKEKKGTGMYEKTEKSVKLKMKDGAVVDPDSELEDIGHVFKEGKMFYSCVLNRISIEDQKNSYYKIQIIESDVGKSYWVFKSWGRIGTTIGGTKLDEELSKREAIEIFCEKYGELTGNEWGPQFVKHPGMYTRLEIDYGGNEHMNKMVASAQKSALPMSVQELVCLIFDVDRMKRAMMEFELNLDEMPLGKISKKQVTAAYSVLNEAQSLIDKLAKGAGEKERDVRQGLLDASNRFYSMIPHSFGTRSLPVFEDSELIKAKIEMLENLLEIELAYEMLLEGDKGGESSVDSHFKTLNAAIDPVEMGSEDYVLLEKYLKNTHAETHSAYTLEIENIFKVNRAGENKRYRPFKELHNRKLLWHGSRVTNYAGILSQGLRIAPPEAPVTGYMFGKGVYFADMVSKSANYCNSSPSNSTALLLVCEVALGDMHEMKSAKDTLTKAPKDCHSVKGLGQTAPNPSESVTLPDGVEVPIGKPTKTGVKNADLLYNEYIVYDTAQVNIRYLMKVNFNFTKSRR